MNIRTRLTLLFALLVASILLLFSVFTYYQYSQFRETEFQQRLVEKATTTVRLRDDVGEVPGKDLPVLSDEQVTIYNEQNKVVYNSNTVRNIAHIGNLLTYIRQHKVFFFKQSSFEGVGITFRDHNNQLLVVVATAYDRYGFSKIDRLRQILFLGWLVGLIIVGISGWLFASDALRPVSEIITQVNAISATNIHKRLRVGRQRDELAQLAHTFNQMLNRLEEAFISQKSFVSHASHELRTPLTVMMGQIDVTLMSPRSTTEYAATLENVLEEVRKMISLTNGLLELAHINADAATIDMHAVRVDEMLWQARTNILHKQPDYQIDIEFDNFPEQEEDLTLTGESALLTTAFQNLMENGCKYSPKHSVRVVLSFTAEKIKLQFIDQGYGISDADLPHIFEAFYRSENTMQIQGHGIGLALTYRIIQLHHGQLRIHSVLNQGTTITLYFPVQAQQ
ncbi:HAMP domain-containing sensor histidine kinase [Arsenicibacter rosenii]|uniref:histidine kinase n=1 Tax=Arsenicibacter rosenii TaxID=1750698 RepID=A0A1S2VJE7_9BACT|nr:ATP-binding protein [Arsenicibacter rosenii]OIN58510.1 two-component sensor histidine kinase [Arsenicibacter rosenii]